MSDNPTTPEIFTYSEKFGITSYAECSVDGGCATDERMMCEDEGLCIRGQITVWIEQTAAEMERNDG